MNRSVVFLFSIGILVFWATSATIYSQKFKIASQDQGNFSPQISYKGSTSDSKSQMGFGYKTAWFAVRSTDPLAVIAALNLKEAQVVDWKTGMESASEYNSRSILVTPPIRGWVLAVGESYLMEADGQNRRLIKLSREFGEAQFFASMRVSDAYIWSRARNGSLECHFDYGDGAIHRAGSEKDIEKQIGLNFFDDNSPESKSPNYYKRKDLKFPDEADVLKVAGYLGVNPIDLSAYKDSLSKSYLGKNDD